MSVNKLGLFVLVPLLIIAIVLYWNLPRGSVVVAALAAVFLTIRLMFARRM